MSNPWRHSASPTSPAYSLEQSPSLLPFGILISKKRPFPAWAPFIWTIRPFACSAERLTFAIFCPRQTPNRSTHEGSKKAPAAMSDRGLECSCKEAIPCTKRSSLSETERQILINSEQTRPTGSLISAGRGVQ